MRATSASTSATGRAIPSRDNAQQRLIAQHDVDRLVELVEAPDARSAGHGPRTTGGDDAAIRSLQAHGAEDASWELPTSGDVERAELDRARGPRRLTEVPFRQVTPMQGSDRAIGLGLDGDGLDCCRPTALVEHLDTVLDAGQGLRDLALEVE